MTLDEIFGLAMYLPINTYRRHHHPLTYIGTKEYGNDVYNLYRNEMVEPEDSNKMTYSDRYYKISHWDIHISNKMQSVHVGLIEAGMIHDDRKRKIKL